MNARVWGHTDRVLSADLAKRVMISWTQIMFGLIACHMRNIISGQSVPPLTAQWTCLVGMEASEWADTRVNRSSTSSAKCFFHDIRIRVALQVGKGATLAAVRSDLGRLSRIAGAERGRKKTMSLQSGCESANPLKSFNFMSRGGGDIGKERPEISVVAQRLLKIG